MEGTRLLGQLTALLNADDDTSGVLQRLCAACVQLLPVTGAGGAPC